MAPDIDAVTKLLQEGKVLVLLNKRLKQSRNMVKKS
jgi:hypothetical protein